MAELSRDKYAYLWVPPDGVALWEEWVGKSFVNDALELSIRNRYFLERLEDFVENTESPAFVNIACGFTSYAHLVGEEVASFELDFPEVVEHKSGQVQAFQEAGKMPERSVTYCGLDLCSDGGIGALQEALAEWSQGRPTYVLLEGITYYLSPTILDELLSSIRSVQSPGSQIAVEYWQPDIVNFKVYQDLQKHFADDLDHDPQMYNLFDMEYLDKLDGYRVIESTSMAEMEEVYCGTDRLKDERYCLPAYFALLERC